MEETTILTQEGLDRLNQELTYLKTVVRPEVSKLIGEAKSFGDLSENSEYDAAKTREAEVELRIREIEAKLKNVTILNSADIDISSVNMGCVVTLRITDTYGRDELQFEIRGEEEGDPEKGILSDKSPLGKALMGKKVGDRFEYLTPNGASDCEVLHITRR